MVKYKTLRARGCFQAALACLLETHPKYVPHFFNDPKKSYSEIWKDINKWLIKVHHKAVIRVPNYIAQTDLIYGYNIGVLTVNGRKKNGLNLMPHDHAVICKGLRRVYDPSQLKQKEKHRGIKYKIGKINYHILLYNV